MTHCEIRRIFSACIVFIFIHLSVSAQCVTNPTYTINSSNNGYYNINSGQSIVIGPNAVFTGTINLNGGQICNRGTIQTTATLNVNNGTLYNYGTVNRSSLSTGSNLYIYNYSYINITGNLNLNSGTYWYEDGMTTVNGSMQLNGTVTGSHTVCGGFQVANQTTINSSGNISEVDFCDWGHPSNGFDVRNGIVASTVTWCACTFIVSPLPVQLGSFNAACGEEGVAVSWVTLSELNNSYFLVERSNDMQIWETVERVDGAGNSNSPLSYTITDKAPYGGTSYYRLTQVDFDGTTKTYDAIAVECYGNSKANAQVSIYPNPSSDYVMLDASGFGTEPAEWSILSLSGSTVASGMASVNEGRVHQQIDISGLAPGMYMLQVGGQSQTIRMIVQ